MTRCQFGSVVVLFGIIGVNLIRTSSLIIIIIDVFLLLLFFVELLVVKWVVCRVACVPIDMKILLLLSSELLFLNAVIILVDHGARVVGFVKE